MNKPGIFTIEKSGIFRNSKRGFTLVEAFIVIATLGIIAAVGASVFSGFNEQKALAIETEKVLSLVSKARVLALSAKDGAAYGVHFEERKAVLFKGSAYNALDTGNDVQSLHDAVQISAIALSGGGSDLVFKRLSGAAVQNGTVTIALVRNPASTRTITIEATGVASSN